MPGVPSGRGCDACRKQKKKCDPSTPSCSRCSRLKIPCVGCNEQRYKFRNQTSVVTPGKVESIEANVPSISVVSSNEMAMVTAGFLTALKVTDVRFDLSIYGEFFKDIPKRLGTNEALDAAASALVACIASVHSRQPSAVTLNRYVHALKTLRTFLSDDAQSRSPDALCAVYRVMIC
jgi:hypothetical protein